MWNLLAWLAAGAVIVAAPRLPKEPVMSRMSAVPVAAGWLGLGAAIGALSMAVTRAQTLPSQQPPTLPAPAQQAQAAPNPRVFVSDAGLVLNFIKAEKTADFEAVIVKMKEALANSDKAERKQQAASWKVYKATEAGPPPGTALYVFVIDPPVKGADYTVSTILAEAFPQEVQTLFPQYRDAYGQGQNVLNLTIVPAAGK
jgi:hypothetical protein